MSNSDSHSKPVDAAAPDDERYHRFIRMLHWLMAAGFILMWGTGILVTNLEGVPFPEGQDPQGAVRDLHKSIGLTLLALLVLRIAARLIFPLPALPPAINPGEQKAAHLGHFAIYATIVLASVTGLAIADLQDYGNEYFGLALPKLFPTLPAVAGWSVDPWSYVIHAVFAYGLIALVLGHIAFVTWHKRQHGVELITRVTALPAGGASRFRVAVSMAAVLVALVIGVFSIRAFVTLGPQEKPRDYLNTTPFSRGEPS